MSGGEVSGSLVEEHRGLVRRIAHDVKRRYRLRIEFEELEAAGLEGLLQAEKAFDPTRGVAFTTFAYHRIRGAIIDNCRRLGALRRSVKSRARFDAAASQVLQSAAQTRPSVASTTHTRTWLADTFDDLAVAFALSQQRGLPQLSTPPKGPEEQAERSELRRRLAAHLDTISDEERVVIERYYFRNDTMQVIARDRGVSVSWISRLHTRALRKLRPALRAEEEHGVEARAGPRTEESPGE